MTVKYVLWSQLFRWGDLKASSLKRHNVLWQRAESLSRGLSPERWAEVPKLLARYERGMFTSCWVFTAMNDAKQESLFQLLIPSQKVPAIHSLALWNLFMLSCWLFWAVVCLILWGLFCKPTWQTLKTNFSFPGKRPGCALQALGTCRKKTYSVISAICQAKPPPNYKQSLKVQFTSGSCALHCEPVTFLILCLFIISHFVLSSHSSSWLSGVDSGYPFLPLGWNDWKWPIASMNCPTLFLQHGWGSMSKIFFVNRKLWLVGMSV